MLNFVSEKAQPPLTYLNALKRRGSPLLTSMVLPIEKNS
jgi:hypothetical protein